MDSSSRCNKSNLDIHFDINGTVIAVDFAVERTVLEEQYLQDFLSKKISAIWETGQKEMTYMEYLKTKYPARELLRKNLKSELYHMFEKMKIINHTDQEKYKNVYEIALEKLKILREENRHVFPSVFRLLDQLQQSHIQATIFLRTFGSEGPLVAEEISQKFPDIQFQKPIDLGKEKIKLPIHSLQDNGHQIIIDDFKQWNENGRKKEYGKPFPVYEESDKISLFFDDNIITDENDCEINNIVNPYNPNTENSVAVGSLIGRCIFRVDTLEAILNDEYFVDIFKKALFSNSEILEQMAS